MQIRSPFKDFYDHAVSDNDPTLFWARTPNEPTRIQRVSNRAPRAAEHASIDQWANWPMPHVWTALHNHLYDAGGGYRLMRFNDLAQDLQIAPACLVLAGHLHFGLKLTLYRPNVLGPTTQWCWTAQEALTTCASWYHSQTLLRQAQLTSFFEPKNVPPFEAVQQALLERPEPTPLVLLLARDHFVDWVSIHINPRLLDLQLATQLSACETYQAIEGYLGLYKTVQEHRLPTVDNTQKIIQAGFDLHTSFRRPARKN